jgi:hypothetical protein
MSQTNPVYQFQARCLTAARAAVKATAERVRQDMRVRIDARKTPSGSAQQANSPRYAAIKARRFGHTTPLWGEDGILRDPESYRVVQRDGWTWVLYPPNERINVIQWLRQRGYEWFEIPKDAPKWLDAELKARLP